MENQNNYSRRRFLSVAALTVAVAELGGLNLLNAQENVKKTSGNPTSHSNASFDAIKQIQAGVLNMAYAESGPADGEPVILLHGWPYTIHSYADVAALLSAKGYRVIVPHLRGHGDRKSVV